MTSSHPAELETGEIPTRIARAAARLFALEGYDATSVRHIVEESGVTKPTLYYYFDSKEGLARSLLTTALGRLTSGLRDILAASTPAVDKLVAVIEEHFKLCRDDPDRARFAYAMFFGPRSSRLAGELAALGQIMAELVSQTVCCLADEGVIARDRIEECTAAVRGLITIHTMDYLYRDLELGTILAGQLVADLLAGFRQQISPSFSPAQRN